MIESTINAVDYARREGAVSATWDAVHNETRLKLRYATWGAVSGLRRSASLFLIDSAIDHEINKRGL